MSRFASLLGGLGLVALGFGLLSALLAILQPVTDMRWVMGNLVVGILLFGASLVVGFDTLRQRLSSGEARRVGRYGSSAIASALLGIAVIGMLGFLATRHSVRFDWSEQQVNSLTEQSRSLIGRLEEPVILRAFFQKTEVPAVSSLLERYVYESGLITLQFVDPNSSPLLVEALGLDPEQLAKGLVRIERGDAGIVVSDLTEGGITNGLLKLTESSTKRVYFLDGHNERLITGAEGGAAEGKESMGRAADALRNETYQVESLPTATRGEIPDDADLVVIAGPTRPYLDHELDALRAYSARGGALLVMIDPRARTSLYELLEEWGVEMGDDVVVDQVRAIFNQATAPLAGAYSEEHPITADVRETTLFPMVRSVAARRGGPGAYDIIVSTGPDAWAERGLDEWMETGRAVFGEGDLDGPVSIALAGTTTGPDGMPAGRLAVFGDSDFASNEFIEAYGNRDLLLNASNWLVGDVDQIGVRPRLSRASRFELEGEAFRVILNLSLFVLPETIAIIGVVAWWRRRAPREPGR